jgi:capsule polysaccharide export protein KpsE/RkpR
MRYYKQAQVALDRFDQGLAVLNGFIKRGENELAMKYMNENLKELFDEIQGVLNMEGGSETGMRVGHLD